MAGTTRDALNDIAADLRNIAGIKFAPDNPPTQMMGAYPFAVVRLESGTYRQTHAAGGNAQALHNIVIEVHVGPFDQLSAYKKLIDLVDDIPVKMINQRASRAGAGNMITWFDVEGGGISYVIPPDGLTYAGVATYGIVYTIPDAKIEVALS